MLLDVLAATDLQRLSAASDNRIRLSSQHLGAAAKAFLLDLSEGPLLGPQQRHSEPSPKQKFDPVEMASMIRENDSKNPQEQWVWYMSYIQEQENGEELGGYLARKCSAFFFKFQGTVKVCWELYGQRGIPAGHGYLYIVFASKEDCI